jgi:hypothetical protein
MLRPGLNCCRCHVWGRRFGVESRLEIQRAPSACLETPELLAPDYHVFPLSVGVWSFGFHRFVFSLYLPKRFTCVVLSVCIGFLLSIGSHGRPNDRTWLVD